jgi:hypothetical protein
LSTAVAALELSRNDPPQECLGAGQDMMKMLVIKRRSLCGFLGAWASTRRVIFGLAVASLPMPLKMRRHFSAISATRNEAVTG